MFFCNNGFAVKYDFVTLYWNNFARIFVNKVFYPTFQYAGCYFAANAFFQIRLVYLNFFGQVEYLENTLIAFKAQGAKQGCYRKFLLAVDICVHDIVNVCSKFNPWAFEWDYSCGIQLCSISMYAWTEKYTGRPVQLWNYYAFRTVNNECSIVGHVRNRSKEYILNHRIEIFVSGIRTV